MKTTLAHKEKRRWTEEKNDTEKFSEYTQFATSIKNIQDVSGLSKYKILKSFTSKEIMKLLKSKKRQEEKELKPSLVLDASVCGWHNIQDKIDQYVEEGQKMILTSMTIRELEKIKESRHRSSFSARYILAVAVKNPQCFECVNIEEAHSLADDNLIEYCKNNKDNVVLVTRDNGMTLKARALGIKTLHLEDLPDNKSTDDISIKTLYGSVKLGNELILTNLQSATKATRVLTQDGIEYNHSTVSVNIGDDVYIAKYYENDKTTVFWHFKVISLEEVNNCKFVYHAKVYKGNKQFLKKLHPEYQRFLKDFLLRLKV